MSQEPDTEGIHQIANTDNSDRVADIVFVHGLGGKSHATWRYGKEAEPTHFFWPEELGKKFPQCGVWSVGYAAGMVPWFGSDGLPIEDRAANLAHKFAMVGLGRLPLIFICHSMGGLMVKEIVVQSITSGDERWQGMVDNVSGVVFCGTPHRGSHVAVMAKRLRTILRTQIHLQDMAAGTRHLDRLHTRFVEWHRNRLPVTEAYVEGIGMCRANWWARLLPRLMIVPPGSGDPQIASCRCIPCHCDHLELVKPRNPGDDVYSGVVDVIQKVLETVQAPAKNGLTKISARFVSDVWKMLDDLVNR